MFFTGFCPKCGQGLLGVRVCSGDDPHAVILCDECDALWTDPDFSEPVIYPEQPELPCPQCQSPLQNDRARWASHQEVEAAGWVDEVRGEYTSSSTRPCPRGNEGPIADAETCSDPDSGSA